MKLDREQLREEWRKLAAAHLKADDEYQRAKEGKQIFLDELIAELIAAEPGMKQATAERMARTSAAYKAEHERVHNLRRKASEAKLAAANADREYWECVSEDANARAEMKMTGFAR